MFTIDWKFPLAHRAATSLLATCLFSATMSATANAAQLLVDSDTYLKTSTAQASSLPAASKCLVTKGMSFEVTSVADGGASHWQVSLPRAYAGCALTSGYIFQPHVSTESNVLGVTTATLFKTSTADSASLPASSKCAMSGGAYSSSAAVSTVSNHFKLTLKAPLAGCNFTTGYVFTGHATAGILQVSTAESVTFTKTKADPASLPASDKCTVAAGNYALRAVASLDLPAYSVSFLGAPAGCGFFAGFIPAKSTYLKAPSFNPADYTAPLASGVAGSGDQSWCACRNVGTSPHIGQDWNVLSSAAENSVALVNATVVDKTFSSTCGHTLTLRDAGGADWIYRHLNSNAIQIGQSVSKGQFLGSHSTYPTSSCGTGPHLHFERRSAGAFADNEVVKTCQFGPSSCNWDPNAPFKAAFKSASAASESASRVIANMTERAAIANASGCRVNPASYGKVANSTLEQFPVTRRAQGFSFAGDMVSSAQHRVLNIAAALGNNAENTCATGACLSSWSVVAETKDGEFVRIFHDGAIKNRPVVAPAEEAHCMPKNATGKLIVLATDQSGAKYRHEVNLR